MLKAHSLALPFLLLALGIPVVQAQDSRSSDNSSAARNFFLEADITGVELVEVDDREILRVIGTIDASSFKRAWMKIGAGENPERWKYVGQKRKYPIHDDTLGKIPITEFYGSDLWQVVINVEHVDGSVKSDTYQVRLN